MPERVQKLRDILEELEEQLEELESLDDETRELLRETVADLHRKLDRAPDETFEPEGLVDRLRRAEEQFQVSHPTLSGIVLRTIDALGQLGI